VLSINGGGSGGSQSSLDGGILFHCSCGEARVRREIDEEEGNSGVRKVKLAQIHQDALGDGVSKNQAHKRNFTT
jgi:hypothetical protein